MLAAMPRRRLPKSFRPAESESLIAAAVVPRDRCIILIGLYAGLRVSEILNLEVTDVNLDQNLLAVNRGKGDRDRVCPLPDLLAGPLRDWIGARTEGFLFESPRKPGQRLSSRAVQRMMKRVAKAAGFPDWEKPRGVNPHRLRHTFCSSLLRAGCDIATARDLMGHASISSTQIYSWSDPFRMKAAVDLLDFGPRSPGPPEPLSE